MTALVHNYARRPHVETPDDRDPCPRCMQVAAESTCRWGAHVPAERGQPRGGACACGFFLAALDVPILRVRVAELETEVERLTHCAAVVRSQ